MLTIWKYEVTAEDYFTLSLPIGAKPLSVQVQGEAPQMWMLLDKDETIYTDRRFRVAGTGHPISESADALQHIDTFQLYHGGLIFHVFEILPNQVDDVVKAILSERKGGDKC